MFPVLRFPLSAHVPRFPLSAFHWFFIWIHHIEAPFKGDAHADSDGVEAKQADKDKAKDENALGREIVGALLLGQRRKRYVPANQI